MQKHQHFIIHKPYGFLSQFINNQTRRKNKKLLGQLHNFPDGTMSIGRLDENSEGLLLLTTDGKVSEYVRSKKVEKEYHVQVDGVITPEILNKLIEGVEIKVDGKPYKTLPCKAEILTIPPIFPPVRKRNDSHGPTSWISITISEGKFRQVRKMSASIGFPTIRLIRIRIGNTFLNDLAPGEVTEVEEFDIN